MTGFQWVTLGVFVVIAGGLVVLAHMGFTGSEPALPPPPLPGAEATAQQVKAVQDYYRQEATRCPRMKIDPALVNEFLELPQVLAVLKYLLDHGTWGSQGGPDKARRERLRQLLDDPTLELRYSPPKVPVKEVASDLASGAKAGKPKSVTAAQTVSGNLVTLGVYAGGIDPKDYMPWRHPFRLATTILHELVHVDQIRHEGASPRFGNMHYGNYEKTAYGAERAIPEADKSLFHKDSLAKLRLPCGGRASLDPNDPDGKPIATTLVLTRVQYRIDKVTGTSSAGTPRDLSRGKEEELKPASGTIPVGYSNKWATGFAKMEGSVTFAFPATLEFQKQANGRYTAKGQATLSGKASWSNQGLGFGRPTGIWIGSGTFFKELGKDNKGSFANGPQSAAASGKDDLTITVNGPPRPGAGEWTAGTYTVRIEGPENRIVTVTAIYQLVDPRVPS
jgi:hypothetical protein